MIPRAWVLWSNNIIPAIGPEVGYQCRVEEEEVEEGSGRKVGEGGRERKISC